MSETRASEAPLGPIRHVTAAPPPEARPQKARSPLPLSRLDEITARDLMTPGVITISEAASLGQDLKAIATHGRHAILVVGRTNSYPLGWITDRGLSAHLDTSESDLQPIRGAITEDVGWCPQARRARQPVAALSRARTTHLLVAPAAGVTPEGVVSAFDLVRAASE